MQFSHVTPYRDVSKCTLPELDASAIPNPMRELHTDLSISMVYLYNTIVGRQVGRQMDGQTDRRMYG